MPHTIQLLSYEQTSLPNFDVFFTYHVTLLVHGSNKSVTPLHHSNSVVAPESINQTYFHLEQIRYFFLLKK